MNLVIIFTQFYSLLSMIDDSHYKFESIHRRMNTTGMKLVRWISVTSILEPMSC